MMIQLCYRVLNTRGETSADSHAAGDHIATLDWGPGGMKIAFATKAILIFLLPFGKLAVSIKEAPGNRIILRMLLDPCAKFPNVYIYR